MPFFHSSKISQDPTNKPHINVMKLPQPTLSEMQSKQHFYRVGKLGVTEIGHTIPDSDMSFKRGWINHHIIKTIHNWDPKMTTS